MLHSFRSPGRLFGASIRAIWRNIFTLLLCLVWPFLFMAGAIATDYLGQSVHGAMAYVVVAITGGFILLTLLDALASITPITITLLASAEGEKISYFEAWRRSKPYIWRCMGLAFCVLGMVVGGLLLAVIPGLFMIRRYLLAQYFMVDMDAGVFESMRLSKAAARKYQRPLWEVVGMELGSQAVILIPILGWTLSGLWAFLFLGGPAIRYVEIKDHGFRRKIRA